MFSAPPAVSQVSNTLTSNGFNTTVLNSNAATQNSNEIFSNSMTNGFNGGMNSTSIKSLVNPIQKYGQQTSQVKSNASGNDSPQFERNNSSSTNTTTDTLFNDIDLLNNMAPIINLTNYLNSTSNLSSSPSSSSSSHSSHYVGAFGVNGKFEFYIQV